MPNVVTYCGAPVASIEGCLARKAGESSALERIWSYCEGGENGVSAWSGTEPWSRSCLSN